ncbi:LPXTG-motif cell wall anchor domain-containing protein [Streptomyces sp. DvalAA-14]|uniref:LAETG motif-containing sortase-dependent surface protein n=1 Tax=unclassified Streptomyces TaxID=2593676 RepID=UPI00081AF3C9|nr:MULTISPECIES: LAETG motif-containing sortase-dependent surface protein [unclassified Streptomyces]MYS21193.1 LPXTG cell wall anchor domain-containing protein [Streptomyces sp. SID4948]SCD86624.1 LPXTG-motif cell wall anchor domain-containing protein [Streptomyces sp. DvalAA-14]
MRMTRENRRRSAVIAGAGLAALAGAGILAVPASAHSGVWSVTCDSVSVHLKDYNARVTNSVTLSVDGGAVLASKDSFGGGYDFSGALPDHTTALTVHLVVTAGDSKQYNIDQRKTSEPCEKPPTTPPPTSPGSPPPTTPPPTTTAPAPPTGSTTPPPAPPTATATTNAPVVAGTSTAQAGGNLAETGSSSDTPMIAGIAVAAVVVGGGALVFARRRRSSSHR